MPRFKPPGQCPVCGEWVAKKQVACDECGSCAKSGWNDGSDYDGLDLPDDDFDYEAFIEKEFGGSNEKPKHRIGSGRYSRVYWWGGVLVLAAMLLAILLQLTRAVGE